MQKPANRRPSKTEDDLWGDQPPAPEPQELTTHQHYPLEEPPQATARAHAPVDPSRAFDMEGLMTDFPTARELERFVFDETGVVLQLKGRANRIKYQVALDVLNGVEVDAVFIGNENPYVDKADMVPEEPHKVLPARDAALPARTEEQNYFITNQVPHPDPDYRARGRKCDVIFRKYRDGTISYEILGPIEPRPYGEKIDKFGRTRPEIIKWVDPRTGEQMLQRADGTTSQVGQRLRALLQNIRVNKTNFWQVWVDRDFASLDRTVIANPWGDA